MFNPIKLTLKSEILSLFLIFVSFASSFYFFINFPDRVPMHWNFEGDIDGYGSAFSAAFLAPALMVFVYLLFLVLPYTDPKKDRYEQFAGVYSIFKNLIILFLAILYFISSFNALGKNVPVEILTPALVGLLMVILGNFMKQIKTNWFVGIRTPWTMSNEIVWNKTHAFGGKVFVLAGLLMMLSPLLPINFRVPTFIIAIVVILLGTVVYSYFAYLIEEKKAKKRRE